MRIWSKTKAFGEEYVQICKKYNYISPKEHYRRFLKNTIDKNTIWLDAGCGWNITFTPKLDKELVKRAKYVCGVDTDKTIYNHKSIKNLIVARLEKIPLKDEKFNLITCNFVVEHLVNPSEVFNEFNRLLKKNGKLVITTPNSLAYDTLLTRLTSTKLHKKIKKIIWERPEEDTFTTKYKANTPFKLKKLLSEAGFEEEKIQMLHSSDLFTFSKSLFVSSIILNKIFDLGFLKYFKPNIFAIYKKL